MQIPNLRFPEFEDEWEVIKLGDIALKVGSGSTPKGGSEVYQKYGIPFIRSQNVINNKLILDETYISFELHKKMQGSKVFPGDVLLNITGGSIGRSCVAPKYFDEANVNQHVSIIRLQNDNSIFLQQFLSSYKGQKIIFQSITGSGREGINFKSIRNYKINFPSLPEQQKIADFLSQVDKKIELLSQKETALREYKKGVMQKLFSQEIRFKPDPIETEDRGEEYTDWEDRIFSSLLDEHKLKSTGKEIVHSVSVHKGIVNQIEHLGRNFSAKDTDNYNLVKPNDIVYTKSPTGDFPFGIIKQNFLSEDVIVSPLYRVFTPETKYLGYILDAYFESSVNTSNYLKPIVQKGAKNTINISNNTFLSNKLFLPTSKNEQEKIANFLSRIDDKIEAVASATLSHRQWKKGLLQKMFV